MQATSHQNNGTLVRYIAVLFVCLQHGFMLAGAPDPLGRFGPVWIGHLGVLMFFALSGFLLVGKLQSDSLGMFVANRMFRIFPLLVAVDIGVIGLGYFFANERIGDYLDANSLGLLYNNLFSHGQTGIDGVAIGPVARDGLNRILNLAQWSIFYELRAYLLLVGLWVLGVLSDRRIFNAFLVAVVLFGSHAGSLLDWGDPRAYEVTLAFLFGVFLRTERLGLSFGHLLAAAAVGLASILLETDRPYFNTVWLFCLCFVTVTVAFGRLPHARWAARLPDLTYGVYLLHWPVALLLTHAGIESPVALSIGSFMLAALVAYPLHVLLEEPARLLPRRLQSGRPAGWQENRS